jgi:4-diphosphocytidyl-2-C-methyl-D-erythritol kinase
MTAPSHPRAAQALPLAARAPAKINLGLFVGPARADGRHELVSVMQSISLADELTLRQADTGPAGGRGRAAPRAGGDSGAAGSDRVVCPGVPGPPQRNLAAAALAAFRGAVGWQAPQLELTIDKRVPIAAGMGGGSGDAAAVLRLAAAASGFGDEPLLLELARSLGADVPAQVRPGRWLARGAGEQLLALPEPRVSFGILVLPAKTPLSTAAVYAHADRTRAARGAAELDELHDALARTLADGAALPAAELLGNDLQDAARALCPEIDTALAQTRGAGADVALLSGSGPTVLGLFAGVSGVSGAARARAAARALASERGAAGAPAPLLAEPVGAAFAAVEPASR